MSLSRDKEIDDLKRELREICAALRVLLQGRVGGAPVAMLMATLEMKRYRLSTLLRGRNRGDDAMIAGWIDAGIWL